MNPREHPPGEKTTSLTRRSFVRRSAAALAGITILPRHVLGGRGFTAPSDVLTLACVGVGSQGLRVMMDFLRQPGVRVAAVCDPNRGSGDFVPWWPGELRDKVRALVGDASWGPEAGNWAGREPARDVVERYYAARGDVPDYTCAVYTDYRELLAREAGIDAVVVGTPDHLHAPVAIAAMRHGKHVFCQKPMAHSVHAALRMEEVAREAGVATQVATGNAASEDTRRLSEWVWSGAIGPVREVHNWSDRPFWPQGLEVPATAQPVPEHLDWELWLGPAAARPYHEAYQPFRWRGWFDFGASAIGDMGCYSFDTLFRVLRLTAPERIEASSTHVPPASYPVASKVRFDFPARAEMPPVSIYWYDGGLRPDRPEELGEAEMPRDGLLLVGDRGKILCGFNGAAPRLLPEAAMAAFEEPPKTLPRSIGHYEEWIEACKGGAPPGARFSVARPVTDAVLLGNVAVRTGGVLRWDAASRTVVAPASADELLRPAMRTGWEV